MNLTNFVVGLGFNVNKRQLDSSMGAIDQLASSAKSLSAVLASGAGFSAISTISSNLFKLKNTADDLGISVEKLRSLGDSARFTGGNLDSMVSALQTIKSLMETPDIEKAGLFSGIAQVTNGANINLDEMLFGAENVEDAFLNISDAVDQLDKGQKKNFLDRLGLSDPSIRLMLQKSREDIQRLIEQESQYSSNMDEVIDKSVNLEHSLQNLNKNFRSLGETFTKVIAPQLTSLSDLFGNLTDQFNKDLNADLKQTSDNLNLILSSLAAIAATKVLTKKKKSVDTKPTPEQKKERKETAKEIEKLEKEEKKAKEKIQKKQEKLEQSQEKPNTKNRQKQNQKKQNEINKLKKQLEEIKKEKDLKKDSLKPKVVNKSMASKVFGRVIPITLAAALFQSITSPKSLEDTLANAKDNPADTAKKIALDLGTVLSTDAGATLGSIAGGFLAAILSGGTLTGVGALAGGALGGFLGGSGFNSLSNNLFNEGNPFSKSPPSLNSSNNTPTINDLFKDNQSTSLQANQDKEMSLNINVLLDGEIIGKTTQKAFIDQTNLAISATSNILRS